MIKKLDILIIRSFIGPFIVTFFVSLFVLVMQFFWLYMDELIGKGIPIWTIMQLLVYMSTTLVPLALPLSVLLASIMTFGNMGENYELVAIKSSGISFLRFMQPLLIFIILIAGLAFVFANNAIPVANLKAFSLLYDVRNAKPTLNIRPDQFNNEITGYSIRVGSKDPDGNTIRDVIIYDHSESAINGNSKVIVAKQGQMIPAGNKQALVFKLTDGWRYEEGYNHGTHDFTQTRMHFAHWDKVFDMSAFGLNRTNEEMFKNAYQMMNVNQLSENIDSFRRSKTKLARSVTQYMSPYISIEANTNDAKQIQDKIASAKPAVYKYDTSFIQHIPDASMTGVLQTATANMRSLKLMIDGSTIDKKLQVESYLKYEIEFHKKFTLSFACILLFLIGAPLGAIIRKGGLGMPLVVALVFFISFYFLNTTGEKLVKTGSVTPWIGMWMSTFILMPFAIWLIISARNDSQIFAKEAYIRGWRRIRKLFPGKKQTVIEGKV